LVIDTVVCLTLAKWETVSGRFGGYLIELENSRLRKAVSDLTLDKLILQEAARGNF
jgi:hypothetical protein